MRCSPLLCLAVVAVVAAARAPQTVHAQSPVVGKWLLRYEHETRGVHVGTPATVVDTVRLTLQQRGDSIIGDWQPLVAAGDGPAPSRALRGVVRRDTVHLRFDPADSDGYFAELGREVMDFLKEHIHGIPPMSPAMEAVVRGDSLVGARWSESADGSVKSSRRALSALREKP